MLVLLSCLVLLPVLVYVAMWLTTRRARRLLAACPTWPELPFVGHAFHFWGDHRVIYKTIEEIGDKSEAANRMFKFWFGSQLVLVSHKAEDVRTVTNMFIEKPYYYNRFSNMWLGQGLLTGPGHVWKRNVKNLSATFAGSVIDGFQDIFDRQAAKLVNNLRKEIGRPPFDPLHNYFAYATLETICQTALGITPLSESIVTAEYYNAFNRNLQLIVDRAFNIFTHPDFIYRLTPGYREMKKNCAILHNVSMTVIELRRKEHEEKKKKELTNESDTRKTKFRPFLDIIMELSDTDPLLTDEQIRNEVDTVILGGQETSATCLLFTLVALGSHMDVQDKLYKEIKSVFGDSKRSVQKEDLVKLKYCEAVIFESLRLFPPIPAAMRVIETDTEIDGLTVPAGSMFALNVLGAGRSFAAYGPDARKFRPDRWLENPPVNPASFVAFSYGRRACIGKRYALAFLKTTLCHIIRDLKIHSCYEDLCLEFSIALRASRGNLITVEARS